MKCSDLKKEVAVEGKYIYDITRYPESGVVKYLSPKAVTVEFLMEALIALNKRIEQFEEARDNMEKMLSENISA